MASAKTSKARSRSRSTANNRNATLLGSPKNTPASLSVQISCQCLSYHRSRSILFSILFFFIICVHITPTLQSTKNLHLQNPYLPISLTDVEDKWYKLKGFKEKECFAVQSSIILRNGVNFPPEKLVKDINNLHKRLVEAMDLDVNSKLYDWNNPFQAESAELISKRGRNEQHTLGKQIALKLLSLFGNEDIGDVTFLTSSQKAPKESSHSFYSGFFDGLHGSDQHEEDSESDEQLFDTDLDDKLLKFYDRCPFSVKTETRNEFSKFLASKHMESVKDKITEMLHIPNDKLTLENVWHIYLICGFEQANFDSSPWCSLLDEDDMQVLEYLGDLKLHHEVGYGTNKSWSHGCVMLTEIFTAMEEAIDEIEGIDINEEAEGYNVGLFGFAEAETVATFLSVLGLFNDSIPLTADNFESNRQRHFQGGQIIPFSANVNLILYECAPEDHRKAETSYFVKLFVNEKPTLIPGCSDLYCPFQQVTKHYQYLTDECQSKRFCGPRPTRDEL